MSIDFNLMEQISTLVWAHTGDSNMAEQLATVKLIKEVWQRLSGNQELEALRTETILRIAKFVKEHPKASKEELANEIEKQIKDFADKVERM